MQDKFLTEESILREQRRLGPDDSFTFRCGRDLACFTHCCRDVAIVLTPYDVLRLKRALGVDSTTFLQKYTISPFTPEQKIPVVLLKMDPESKRCQLVAEEGCTVYANRPWSCRMYPLGVAQPKNPTPTDRAFYFLVQEDLCQGHGQGEQTTVRQWTESQGAEEYEMMGASFKELMLHEFWEKDEPLDPRKMDMFFMACYDLDRFHRFVFESSFLDRFDVDEARAEAMKTNDAELLEFAMQWLRFTLFGERTMKIRRTAA